MGLISRVSSRTYRYNQDHQTNQKMTTSKTRLCVKNLNKTCTPDQVREYFSTYGTITDVKIKYREPKKLSRKEKKALKFENKEEEENNKEKREEVKDENAEMNDAEENNNNPEPIKKKEKKH